MNTVANHMSLAKRCRNELATSPVACAPPMPGSIAVEAVHILL